MIRITNLLDLWKCKTIPRYIFDSMEGQLIKLCREWLVTDISDFGTFYYIENTQDLDKYREIGMTERIETAEPEWITMLSGNNEEKCYQICHIIDDGFGIYIFCEEKFFSAFSS